MPLGQDWWNPHVTALGFFLKQKARNYGLYHIYANTAWWRANQHNLTEVPPPLCRHHKPSASSKANYWHQVQMNTPFSSLLHIWVSLVLYNLHSFLNNLSLWLLFYFNYKKQKETISFLVSKLFSPEFCDIFQTMVFSITRAACILLILAGGRHDLKALQLWVCFPPFQPNNLTFSFIVHSCSHNSLL